MTCWMACSDSFFPRFAVGFWVFIPQLGFLVFCYIVEYSIHYSKCNLYAYFPVTCLCLNPYKICYDVVFIMKIAYK